MRYFPHIVLNATTILAITGFVYYFFAPLNWGAGEYIMHFHLWFGIVFMLYFAFNILKHVKTNINKITNPAFKYVAYTLLTLFSLTLLSGFLHFIPYVSYFSKPLYYRFETYDLFSTIHLICAISSIILLAMHLIISPKEKNEAI